MGRRLAVSAKLARHAPGEAQDRTGPEVVRRIALAMVAQDFQVPPPQVVGLVRMREPILAAVTWWMAGVWGYCQMNMVMVPKCYQVFSLNRQALAVGDAGLVRYPQLRPMSAAVLAVRAVVVSVR
ncbi:hypothetical protein CF132_17500 [Aeromonas dhakensis]|nr:hypothetical protein CF132_17500 [Aeromonas dhakensis]